MKTIHVFARLKNDRLIKPRRSESPETKHEDEILISTITGQPDNYWEIVAKENDGFINDGEPEKK